MAPESAVAKGERVPRWARPSLVIRDGRSIRYQFAGRLQPNDQVYLFIPPRYLRLMDRLFASPAPLGKDDADFFGAFVVDPNAPLLELEKAYEVPIGSNISDLTIAGYIEQRLGGHADIGDRVSLGDIELIVRDTDDAGAIKLVGLSIEPRPPKSVSLVHLLNAREAVKRLWSRWLNKRW